MVNTIDWNQNESYQAEMHSFKVSFFSFTDISELLLTFPVLMKTISYRNMIELDNKNMKNTVNIKQSFPAETGTTR